jgi:DNA-binding MarR family transcriptional regulator
VTAGFQRTPGHLVRRAHQFHNTIFAEETQGRDVTAPQFAALRALNEYPDIDQTTLSRIISFDRATIGGLVDRLEAKGLVRRTVDKADRRSRTLRLTAQGRALLALLSPMLERVSERMLAPLAPSERKQLLDLLERVIAHEGADERSGRDDFARAADL